MAKKHGLVVAQTKHSYDFVRFDENERKRAIEGTKTALNLAAGAGIDKIQVYTGPGFGNAPLYIGKDIPEGKAWEFVYEAFDEIVPVAEKLGVYLTVEPVYNHVVRDYYTLMELLNHYKSKALAVNFDTGNFQLYQTDLSWVTRRLGKLIMHTHIKDAVGKAGLSSHMREDISYAIVGEGAIDWKGWLNAMKDIGYQGYMSFEFRPERFEKMGFDLESILRVYKRSLEKQIEMA